MPRPPSRQSALNRKKMSATKHATAVHAVYCACASYAVGGMRFSLPLGIVASGAKGDAKTLSVQTVNLT